MPALPALYRVIYIFSFPAEPHGHRHVALQCHTESRWFSLALARGNIRTLTKIRLAWELRHEYWIHMPYHYFVQRHRLRLSRIDLPEHHESGTGVEQHIELECS